MIGRILASTTVTDAGDTDLATTFAAVTPAPVAVRFALRNTGTARAWIRVASGTDETAWQIAPGGSYETDWIDGIHTPELHLEAGASIVVTPIVSTARI